MSYGPRPAQSPAVTALESYHTLQVPLIHRSVASGYNGGLSSKRTPKIPTCSHVVYFYGPRPFSFPET